MVKFPFRLPANYVLIEIVKRSFIQIDRFRTEFNNVLEQKTSG